MKKCLEVIGAFVERIEEADIVADKEERHGVSSKEDSGCDHKLLIQRRSVGSLLKALAEEDTQDGIYKPERHGKCYVISRRDEKAKNRDDQYGRDLKLCCPYACCLEEDCDNEHQVRRKFFLLHKTYSNECHSRERQYIHIKKASYKTEARLYT